MQSKVRSTQAEREVLLVRARWAQTMFWNAMKALENAYGVDAEIDSTQDLEETTVTQLDADMRDAGFHVVDSCGVGE